MSGRSSSLNSSGIICSLCAFFYAHSSQLLSLIRPAAPTLVLCTNSFFKHEFRNVRNFFQPPIYSYGYTPFRIIRRKFSSYPQNLLVRLKLFFNSLSSRSFVFFVLHLSHPSNAVYSSEIFISSISSPHLSH